MNLQPQTLAALRKWLGCDTWHTSHPNDEERFFHFVDALRQDIGTIEGKEDALMDLMRKTLRETGWTGGKDCTDEMLRERKSHIWVILDFCKTVGIPRHI